MTNEKAIEMFRAGIETTECEVKKDLYQTAILALDKQIPKKPIKKRTNIGAGDHFYNCCPSCQEIAGFMFNYCENCGQRFDWSE